jgi:putative transcriptional regulator
MSKCHASTPSTRTIARRTPSTSRAMLSSLAHGAHIAYRAHAPPSRCENARTRARSVALELNSGRLRRHLPGRRRETSVWARAGRENDDVNERNEQTQNEGDDRAHAVDWREFRARMVARYSENAALGASIDAASRDGSPPTWAHGLENLEKGALLVAVEEDASSFWSHVVIFMLGEWFGRRALEKKEGGRKPRRRRRRESRRLTFTLAHVDADHTPYGSTGIILNRTQSWTLAKHCPEVKHDNLYWSLLSEEIVGVGGPVGLDHSLDRSVIALTTKEQPGMTEEVIPGIYRVINLDQLAKLNAKLSGPGTLRPEDLSLFVGYSGWSPGQLQSEIDAGFWTLASASGTYVRDCMFKHVMDTIVEPTTGKRVPIDAHGFQAWASMRESLGM